jgi:hypothetical protein
MFTARCRPPLRIRNRIIGKQVHMAVDKTHDQTMACRDPALNPYRAFRGNCAIASPRPYTL